MALTSLTRIGLALALLPAVEASAQGAPTPPHLLKAIVPPSPFNVQSGGVAAFALAVDEKGSVTAVDTVQDVAPYGDALREALRGWSFEPARRQRRALAPASVESGAARMARATGSVESAQQGGTVVREGSVMDKARVLLDHLRRLSLVQPSA